jgi:hypothetical protein
MYNCNFNAIGNKIHSKTSFSYFYGAYLYNVGTTTNPSLFANNEIIGITSGTYYGIYSTSAGIIDIINNSIHMSGSGASRNIHIVNNTGANYTIKNNLLVNTSSGYRIYISGTTTPFTSIIIVCMAVPMLVTFQVLILLCPLGNRLPDRMLFYQCESFFC